MILSVYSLLVSVGQWGKALSVKIRDYITHKHIRTYTITFSYVGRLKLR